MKNLNRCLMQMPDEVDAQVGRIYVIKFDTKKKQIFYVEREMMEMSKLNSTEDLKMVSLGYNKRRKFPMCPKLTSTLCFPARLHCLVRAAGEGLKRVD